MTTLEKTLFLVNEFTPFCEFRNDGGYDKEISELNARKCAFICASEILKNSKMFLDTDGKGIRYWTEVINQLQ